LVLIAFTRYGSCGFLSVVQYNILQLFSVKMLKRLITVRSPFVHCSFTIRSLFINCPITIRSAPVHCSFNVCALFVHCPFTVRSPSVHQSSEKVGS
jgi:hypothetical protein